MEKTRRTSYWWTREVAPRSGPEPGNRDAREVAGKIMFRVGVVGATERNAAAQDWGEQVVKAYGDARASEVERKYDDLRGLHERLLTVFKATHDLLSAALPYEFWQIGPETQALRAAYEKAFVGAYLKHEGR